MQFVDQIGGEEGGGGLGSAFDIEVQHAIQAGDGLRARRCAVTPSGAAPRVSTTRCGERASSPGSRTSRRGASRATCPPPTRIASACARWAWTWARAASPVIHWLVPSASAMQPSSDVASFSVTHGRPSALAGQETGKAGGRGAIIEQVERQSPPPAAARSPPGGARIGVVLADHDARRAGRDDQIGAGRAALAMVGAGFERDVKRRFGQHSRRKARQRHRFGMRAAAACVQPRAITRP